MPWNKDDDGKNTPQNDKPPVDRGPWGKPPGNDKPSNRPGPNWGGGNRGGGNGLPPEFDDLFKKGKDSINQILPQGGGRGTWLLPIAAVLAFWAYKSVYQVQPDERGMVMRLGAYTRTVSPGLQFAPWPIEKMELLPVAAEQQISIGDDNQEGLMLTGDENMLEIKFKVLWKISDPQKYQFNVSDQVRLVRAVAESAMREIVGRTPATVALTTGRLSIQDQVKDITQRTLDSYNSGVVINGLALEVVDPPPPVLDAFEDVQRAKQDQQKSINDADKYANNKLRNAEGDAAKLVEDAKGYKAKTVAESKGEAQRFQSVYEQYAKAKDVTRERLFLETMEKVLANSNKVIMDPGKSGQGVVPYLPLPALPAPAPAQTQGSTQ
ncbi:MAG: FtsH protease activity modulator HflK [Alphaproteobacteria bacterium]|nr:FtsH protease activity modulator HflK [Alphaproteobacteria bacterium]